LGDRPVDRISDDAFGRGAVSAGGSVEEEFLDLNRVLEAGVASDDKPDVALGPAAVVFDEAEEAGAT
jgi:hypothetical protein